MNERRKRRSGRKDEALQMLLESVRERSDVSSIAIIDGRGRVVAGVGSDHELEVLSVVAAPAASGSFDTTCELLTLGTDVLSCPLASSDLPRSRSGERMYLAALGDRVARMPEAARGAARILRT